MKNKIYELLDKLIVMSNSEINIELNVLEKNISEKEVKLEKQISAHEHNSYDNTQEKEIDLKYKTTLKNETEKIKSELNDLYEKHKKINKEQRDTKLEIDNAKENINLYIELIKNATNKLVSKQNTDIYNNIIDKKECMLDFWNNKHDELNSKLDKINLEEELIRATIEDLEYKNKNNKKSIEMLNIKLEDTKNYTDTLLKEEKEEEINNLKKEIKNLEIDKLNILTSPKYLCDLLKKFIKENDYENSRSKLNELFGVIETKPYILLEKKDLEKKLKEFYKDYNDIQKRIKTNDYISEVNLEYKKRYNDVKDILKINEENIKNIKKLMKESENNISVISSKITDDLSDNILVRYDYDLNHILELNSIVNNTSLKYLTTYNEKIIKEMNLLERVLKDKTTIMDNTKKETDIQEHKKVKEAINLIELLLKEKLSYKDIKNDLYLILSSLEFDVDENNQGKKYIKVINIINLDETSNDDIDDEFNKLLGDD